MDLELNKKIKILYEDNDIIAINKPAGLVVHSDGRTKEPSLVDWIEANYPDTKGVGEPTVMTSGETIERSGIVHRLDRETSGVMLIAKTQKGHEYLKKQFQDRTIRKKYLTFIHGDLKDDFGIIKKPIGKSPADFRKWSATRGAKGEMREAETWWTRLVFKDRFSLLLVEPKTGRTHQIRVHMKALNHPVVSDKLYSKEKPQALGFTRTALHAWSITFMNCDDKKTTVVAPIPDDFHNAIKELNIEDIAKKEGIC